MSKVDWNNAPQWADEYGFVSDEDLKVWSNGDRYQYIEDGKQYDFGTNGFDYEYFFEIERRPSVVSEIQKETSKPVEDDLYTIKLDADSMNEAVVKFLVQCYKDNQMFREDDGIQDSILDVVRYCVTASEYDSILAELGIE